MKHKDLKQRGVGRQRGELMSDWFGILLTILSIYIGGFALGYKCGKEIEND